MTDTAPPAETSPEAQQPKSRRGLFIGVAAGGLIVLAAIVTLVLVVSIGVIGQTGLPTSAAKRVLLSASDLAKIDGAQIASGVDSEVKTRTLQAYVRANPGDNSHTVTPAKCADNLEGWMAWKSLDTPSYKGWKTDTIYEAANIVVDSTTAYENGLQEVRHFATVSAATAFMSAERSWYSECANTSYLDPSHPKNDSAFHFTPIALNLGLDSIVEGSTDKGRNLPPHLIDVYMRNQNIVYVTELVTNSAPQHGIDAVSRAIVTAAAKKLGSLY
jgi:hypothetical protein